MNLARITRCFPCWLIVAGLLASCDKAGELLAEIAKKTDTASAAEGVWVSEIGADEFDSFRLQNDKVVIIDFHAPWCGPCRQLAPLLEEIATEHAGAVVIGKINVDDHPDLAAGEGVRGIPDVRIYRNGGMVDKLVGLPPPSELKQRVATHVEDQRSATAAVSEAAGGTAGDGGKKEPAVQPMTKDWLPPGIRPR